MGQENAKAAPTVKKASAAETLEEQFTEKFFAVDTSEQRLKVAQEFAKEHPRVLEDGFYWTMVLQYGLYAFLINDRDLWSDWIARAKQNVKFNHTAVVSWSLLGKMLVDRDSRGQKWTSVGLGLKWEKAPEGTGTEDLTQHKIFSVPTSGPLPVATNSPLFVTTPVSHFWSENVKLIGLESTSYLSRLSPDLFEEALRFYAMHHIFVYRFLCNLEILARELKCKFLNMDVVNWIAALTPEGKLEDRVDIGCATDGHMSIRVRLDEIAADSDIETRLEKLKEFLRGPGNTQVRPQPKPFTGIALGVAGDERYLSARISLLNPDPSQLLRQYNRMRAMVDSYRAKKAFAEPEVLSLSNSVSNARVNAAFRQNILYLEKHMGTRLKWTSIGAGLLLGSGSFLVTKPDFDHGVMSIVAGLVLRANYDDDELSRALQLNYLERIFDLLTFPTSYATAFRDRTPTGVTDRCDLDLERVVSLIDVPETFLCDQLLELFYTLQSVEIVHNKVFVQEAPRLSDELAAQYDRPLRDSALPSSQQSVTVAFSSTAAPEHHDINCATCSKPIVGARYLCLNCREEKNYCFSCVTPLKAHDRSHVFATMLKRAPEALERYFKERRPFPNFFAEDEIAQNLSFETADSSVAHSVPCSGCKLSMAGSIYRCMRCRDFRLCPSCFPTHQHSMCHAFLRVNWPKDTLLNMIWSAQFSKVTPRHYDDLAKIPSDWELIYTPLSFVERKALLSHSNEAVQQAALSGLLDAVLFPHSDVPVPSDYTLSNIVEFLKEKRTLQWLNVILRLQTKDVSGETKSSPLVSSGIYRWALDVIFELPSLSSLSPAQVRGVLWLLMCTSAFPLLNASVMQNRKLVREIFSLVVKDAEGVANWAYSALSGEGGSCTASTLDRIDDLQAAVPDIVERLLSTIPQTMYAAFFVAHTLMNLSRYEFVSVSLVRNIRLIKQLLQKYQAASLCQNYLRVLYIEALRAAGSYPEALEFTRSILTNPKSCSSFILDTCDMLNEALGTYYENCFRDLLVEAGYIHYALKVFESDPARVSVLLNAFGCTPSVSVAKNYEESLEKLVQISQSLPAGVKSQNLRVLHWWMRKNISAQQLRALIPEEIKSAHNFGHLNHHYTGALTSDEHYQVLLSFSSQLAQYYSSSEVWKLRPHFPLFFIRTERTAYRDMRLTAACVSAGLLDRCLSTVSTCACVSDNLQLALLTIRELYLSADLLSNQPEKLRAKIADACLEKAIELLERCGEERVFTSVVGLLETFSSEWRCVNSAHSCRAAKALSRMLSRICRNLRMDRSFPDDDNFNNRTLAIAAILRFNPQECLFPSVLIALNVTGPLLNQIQWNSLDVVLPLEFVIDVAIRYPPLCNHNTFIALTDYLLSSSIPLHHSLGRRFALSRAVTLVNSACARALNLLPSIPILPSQTIAPATPFDSELIAGFSKMPVYSVDAAENRWRQWRATADPSLL